MPYKNQLGQTYDSGAFEKILDQGLDLADWNGFAARRAESKARGLLRGRGIASFLEWTGGNALEEKVSVDITPDGIIEIFSATQAMGQGIATSYAQLAVDVFGVPIDRIRIVQGDTDARQRFRQRRLALALHRRLGGSHRVGAHHRPCEDARRRGARGRRPATSSTAPAASPSSAPTSASTCSRSPASSRGSGSISRRRRSPAGRPGRTPATSARSRSIPRAAPSASSRTRRSTTSAASSAR